MEGAGKTAQARTGLASPAAPRAADGPPDPRRLRIFLLKVLLFVAVWGALFFRGGWLGYGAWMAAWTALVSVGLMVPGMARGPRRLVIASGARLGRALSFLALAAIYGLALVPVALLARLFRKRFLEKGKDPALPTYWIPREEKAVDKASLERQF